LLARHGPGAPVTALSFFEYSHASGVPGYVLARIGQISSEVSSLLVTGASDGSVHVYAVAGVMVADPASRSQVPGSITSTLDSAACGPRLLWIMCPQRPQLCVCALHCFGSTPIVIVVCDEVSGGGTDSNAEILVDGEPKPDYSLNAFDLLNGVPLAEVSIFLVSYAHVLCTLVDPWQSGWPCILTCRTSISC
jgi:hypothetical protein